ncbi:MAG: hypothetical protein A2498_08485 [Lentisphaerae bacterium RIFOXYC12_FULL_60_16]|nr:MAG: hypothetical protein A2498_08485 [Lentisphaerae bacterium RIFOXYC12_FULL_60_16]OGV75686.1 MAG: hypothetical protein A2340_12440 [Lentisphaerae bacterium RIFOXYB12_FULL_60_10]
MKSRTFVDTITIRLEAGAGGNGCRSFRREKYVPLGGPDGGDGGKGGDCILVADRDTDSLLRFFFQPEQHAERGEHGRGKQQTGHSGKDLVLNVPCGTEIWASEGTQQLGELLRHGDRLVVAKGGEGGLGNIHFKTSTHQAPTEITEGTPGETAQLRLELKLVADVGLIGFPNAGKSSLLAAITDAHPKIAAYPFTTLNPILGTLVRNEWTRIRVVDIPGLIEDAHQGVGLGQAFLRHIERAPLLVFVIDMAGTDGRSPVDDYRNLRHELKCYRADLLKRPCLVVANKMDIPEAADQLKVFRRKTRAKVMPISAFTGEGLDTFTSALFDLCEQHRELLPSRL